MTTAYKCNLCDDYGDKPASELRYQRTPIKNISNSDAWLQLCDPCDIRVKQFLGLE